jgi:hypothetical protein
VLILACPYLSFSCCYNKKDKARDGGNENGNTITVLKAQNKEVTI